MEIEGTTKHFANTLTNVAICQIIYQAGFDRLNLTCVSVLSDLMEKYIELLTCSLVKSLQLTNSEDTDPSINHILLAFHVVELDTEKIFEFVKLWGCLEKIQPFSGEMVQIRPELASLPMAGFPRLNPGNFPLCK